MDRSLASQRILAEALWPPASTARILRWTALAVIGTILMTISAKIKVPFFPVPMTMQLLVTMLIGAAYGWRLAGAAMLLYLAQGASGLPVFAGTPEKGIGLAYMAGPTGGYLLGFFLAAVIVGWLAERGWDRSVITAFGAMVLGTAAIYAPGIIWLSYLIGFEKAVTFGLYPFVAGDLLKIGLGTAILPLAWAAVRKFRVRN